MISIHDLKDGGIYLMDTPSFSPAVWIESVRSFDSGHGVFGYGYAIPERRIGTIHPDRKSNPAEVLEWIRKARNI